MKVKFKTNKQRKNQYIWDPILTVKMSQNRFTLQTVWKISDKMSNEIKANHRYITKSINKQNFLHVNNRGKGYWEISRTVILNRLTKKDLLRVNLH